MTIKIKQDHARFKDIVRGKIKQNLRRFIQKGEMVGKRGKDFITIPLPTIDIPHFRYGPKQQGGVGQGEGEVGQILAPGEEQPGDGEGRAGSGEGEHILGGQLRILRCHGFPQLLGAVGRAVTEVEVGELADLVAGQLEQRPDAHGLGVGGGERVRRGELPAGEPGLETEVGERTDHDRPAFRRL